MKKILFITLSNIGDVILTLPALDYLCQAFADSEITVMVSQRASEIFVNNPRIKKVIVYNKKTKLKEQIKLFLELYRYKFDMVIDLRHTFFGLFLPAKVRISPFLNLPKQLKHMKDRHLFKAQGAGCRVQGAELGYKSLFIHQEDQGYINKLLAESGVGDNQKLIIIASGARSHIKRWPADKFVELIQRLKEDFSGKAILVGDSADVSINKYIKEHCDDYVLDFTAKTSIAQLAFLLKKAAFLVTNDSAILHVASYINIPVVALFGPTNESEYGPWSTINMIVKKEIYCRPCLKAQCRQGSLACMHLIKAEDVLAAIKTILSIPSTKHQAPSTNTYKRILIVRTDRVGDVILSTPVIKALRDNYPNAFIAMMVSPYTKDVVEGNPYLDEVILYDKDNKHKSWQRTAKFAQNLKKRKFDLAIILHPTNRVHLLTFLAGIPKRVGYNRKFGLLLTDRIKHLKHLGQKHELEYNLDLLEYLGVQVYEKKLFLPIRKESEEWVSRLLKNEGVCQEDGLIAIHPGASCASKLWPQERFAQAADKLIEKYGCRCLVVAGPQDILRAQATIKNMHYPAVNLAARLSLSQLASVLKRCLLLISNDSGPVHISSAVGTPVISIFGRNQFGLGPKRWGPVGKYDKYLHKEVGCVSCLAHKCDKGFMCLKAINVDDVLKCAEEILGEVTVKA